MDEWLLSQWKAPNASGGRGLNFVSVYDRQGTLVATAAQEPDPHARGELTGSDYTGIT